MNYTFKKLSIDDAYKAIEIFNYYITNTMSAYPENPVSDEFFHFFVDSSEGYPAYSIYDESRLIGFGLLRKYNFMSSFNKVAEITCFIHPEYTRQGIGGLLLRRLTSEGKMMGLNSILASVSSKNEGSIRFHKKHEFIERGRFIGVGSKNGVEFDVVWLQKML